jgi:MFS family permease
MSSEATPIFGTRQLRTPRAAAVAGILFAVLYGTATLLISNSIPDDPTSSADWLADWGGTVAFALGLIPFAGIAFLWFVGVVRDRFGPLEDRFFATVFLGSGLLFLAMIFAAASLAGGLLASYRFDPDRLVDTGLYAYGRQVMYRINSVYAVRMAGVFMVSLGSIWIRTGSMPRWMAVLTFGTALGLLVTVTYRPWVILLFPGWVLIVSVYILFTNLGARDGPMSVDEPRTPGSDPG